MTGEVSEKLYHFGTIIVAIHLKFMNEDTLFLLNITSNLTGVSSPILRF